MGEALQVSTTTQIKARAMGPSPSSHRSLFMAASCTCLRTWIHGSSWEGIAGAKAPTKAISKTSPQYPSQRSENRLFHPHSWPNLRVRTLSWLCTRRTRYRWRRQTIRRTSFQKLAALRVKKWRMTTTKAFSTI